MKIVLRLEAAGLLILGLFLFSQLAYPWWLLLVLLFTPDLSMLGYLVNTRVGAAVYNVVHHKAVAVACYVGGALLVNPVIMLVGVVLFTHSAMDRIFDYGLKYPDAFQHTHLGWIGGAKDSERISSES